VKRRAARPDEGVILEAGCVGDAVLHRA
jgi:hypothetical protein